MLEWKCSSFQTPASRLGLLQGLLLPRKPQALTISLSCLTLPLGCLAPGEGGIWGGGAGKGMRVRPGVQATGLLPDSPGLLPGREAGFPLGGKHLSFHCNKEGPELSLKPLMMGSGV